jgi:hypothetical protein
MASIISNNNATPSTALKRVFVADVVCLLAFSFVADRVLWWQLS